MRNLNSSDIATLKNLLSLSGEITDNRNVRENFCKSIGIEIDDISPEGLATLGDKLFIDTLLGYLERTDNTSAFYQLCVRIERHFNGSLKLRGDLKKIKSKLRVLKLVTILDKNNFFTIFDKCDSAYQKCLLHKEIKIKIYNNLDQSLDNNIEILDNLDNHKDDRNNNFSLLDCFVGYLRLFIEHTDNELYSQLNQWLNTDHPNLNDLMVILQAKNIELEERRKNSNPGLLVVVFERNENLKLQAFVIDDILRFDRNQTNNYQELYKEELSLKLADFSQNLRNIYLDSLKYCKNKNFNPITLIKVFLPYKFIDSNIEAIDKITIDENCSSFIIPDTFGKEYEIILEFSERLGSCHQAKKWQDKLNRFIPEIEQTKVQDILLVTDASNPKELYKKLDSLLAIKFINKIERKIIMEMLFYAGIPFALWTRKDIPEEDLNNINIFTNCCLRNLSSSIRKQRCDAWHKNNDNNDNHIGNHLSLLWDVNNLVLPTHLFLNS